MVRKKPWSPGKEKALVDAWLWDKHRMDVQWRRARLGVLPTKEGNRIYKTILRYADVIFLKDGVVNIVEAKLRPDLGSLGQLEGYKHLFPQTLEFDTYRLWPIQKVLLTTMTDLNVVELASRQDVKYEIFTMEDVNRVRREMLKPELILQ